MPDQLLRAGGGSRKRERKLNAGADRVPITEGVATPKQPWIAAPTSRPHYCSRNPGGNEFFRPNSNLHGVDAVLADLERGEPPIRLKDLPSHALVPRRAGKKVHISVVHRWSSAGLKGVRLETARCGGALCTTASAISRFYRRTSGVEVLPSARTSHRRDKELARAEAELEVAGL